MTRKYFYLPVFLCIATFGQVASAGNDGALAVIAASALIAGQINSDETKNDNGISFVPSVGVQSKQLTFDQTYSGAQSNKAKFSISMPVLSTSLTTAYNKFFLTLKYEKSLSDSSTGTNETLILGGSNLIAIPGSETTVERQDQSITLGYNVWSKLNLFVGYMKGKTTLTPDASCQILNPPSLPPSNCLITNRAFIHAYLSGNNNYAQEYTEDGPYVGLSYAWNIADAGVLSASYAYASMDGKYKDNMAHDPTNFFGGTVERFAYSGSTTGNSIGVTWTAPLGETSSYFLDLRQQKYHMSGEDDTGLALYSGVHLSTDETMKSVTAGVQFYF